MDQAFVGKGVFFSLFNLFAQLQGKKKYGRNCELRNKRADIALCDNVPLSTLFVLDYGFGKLEDW